MSQGTTKARALASIRRLKSQATMLRLQGRINDAVRIERQVDREVREAEILGFSDDAFGAEERGMLKGDRKFRRKNR